MKQLRFLLYGLMLSIPLTGVCAEDLRGVTVDGRKVILKSDGTWRFDDRLSALKPGVPDGSPYRPSVKKFSVNYDTQKWTASGDKEEGSNKRIFKHKTFPVYA